ncbi:thioredoxin family protein [Chitinivorax sp. PXF-14]|uniref:thioredoxin family protein n=1 Tax=Chitinivorax sp. PXF-14 TaxID=3230488 RepID=UPI00346516BA
MPPQAPVRLTFEPLGDGGLHRRLAAAAGVSLVMFSRHGCGSCRVAESQLPAWLPGVVDNLFKVDVDINAGLMREFDVFHLPALFLFKNGQFHAPLHCPLTPNALATAIHALITAPAQEAP